MLSYDAFVAWALLPENNERSFELVGGEVIEVLPRSTWLSQLPHFITGPTYVFCHERGLHWHVSGAGGPYRIGDNILVPDFAYKTTPMSKAYPDPEPPLWAVEVISPTDKAGDIRRKRKVYLEAGIVLWEVYDSTQSVDIYVPGQPVRTVEMGGTLDAGDVLPGFTMPVDALFA